MGRKRTQSTQLELGQTAALTASAVFDLPVGADGKRVAPTEFRVFPAGTFSSTKGDWHFTPRSAESVMAYYQRRGVPLMGDYEHMADAVPPVIAPASITEMVPEVRTDARGQPELWVKDIQWTPLARKMLENGEYRLFSPTFNYDPSTREVLALRRIALTNDPSIDNLEPLVAASSAGAGDGNAEEEEEETMGDEKTCAKCAATEAHLSTIKEAHAKLGQDHEKLVKEHTELLTAHTGLTAQLKSVEDWAAGEAQRDGQLTATLSASSGKRPELGTLLTAISTRNKGLLDERTQIVALTGKPDGVLGMLTAWSEQSKELAQLKATQQKERVEALTTQYKSKAESSVEKGLMTPAQRKRCDEVLAASGVEQAMVMLSVIVPDGAQPVVNRIETPTPDAAGDVLSAAEVRNLNVIGLSPQAYLATRKSQRL